MAVIVMGHVEHSNTNGLIMQNGGVVPPSLLQENRVPRFYKEAIAKCGAPSRSQLPNTALVYNLMVASCLPRAVLGNIWSLVNRTMPGQLTRQEFFSCLALIALIQKGQPLSALSTMSTLPIPHLQACAPFTQHLPGGDIFQQPEFCHIAQKTSGSSEIAINLPAVPTTSSAVSLLADIDFSKPVSSSTTFSQSLTMSITQIPTSSSHSPISAVATPHIDSTAFVIQTAVTPASVQSIGIRSDLSNQIFSNGSANSISQNSKPSNVVSNILEPKSPTLLSEAIHCGGSSSANVGVGKSTGILELQRGGKISATPKLTESANKDWEEECLHVWRRCIEEAFALFSDADSLLPDSAAAHIAEIVHTERGSKYLRALYEVYKMTLRIRKGRVDKLIKQKKLLDKIDETWTRLECFIEKNMRNEDTSQLAEGIDKTICGICLLSVSLNAVLEFAGTVYHKQCANLWINRVDSFLPKLKES